MNDLTPAPFGYSDGDVDTNNSTETTLNQLAAERFSRRATLRGGSAILAATLGSSVLAACDDKDDGDDDGAPTVSAGNNITTSAGRLVTLTGTASDDKAVTSVAWTQAGGDTVTLVNANSNTATFIAPAVASSRPLTFTFTASDGSKTTSAQTQVTVNPAELGFTAVAKTKADTVTVPTGYSVQVINRLGDPINTATAAYKNDGTDTGFANRIGDHGDALHWYGLSATGARDDNSSVRGLLVQNHENISQPYLHVNGATTVGGVRPEGEALKEIEAHGVAVTEVAEGASRAWGMVQNSSFNRRITPNTPVVFNGPARGNALLQTAYSTDGTAGRGTINNCANGTTPWATNLTCEENWAGYFRRSGDNAARTAKELIALARYGVSGNGNYSWSTVVPADAANTTFRRWDARATGASATADFRNEPNQFGWVVEIDPYTPNAAPRKRTALGRLGHEGCWPGAFVAGRKPAWYMGDDSRREYMYKFVSATAWSAADASATDRLATGDKYLDNGTLYVAKFNADGTGTWLPLVFGQNGITSTSTVYPFADQADVLVNARLAADVVGATPMDRPEWTAVNPVTGEVYLTLTNNSDTLRPLNGTDAANPRHYNDPTGTAQTAQYGNPNGHIIRLKEAGDTTEALTFTWDVYLFGAGVDLNAANINISGLTADQDFSSPDGLYFGRTTNVSGQIKPLLWIQTDDGAYTDVTNNQMLVAMPGTVGDGGARTITNTGAGGATATQATRVGAAATAATLKRFLVGPVGCELTGVDTTPDGRTIFAGIQHPGELGGSQVTVPTTLPSNWPASQTGAAPTSRPRSAIAVITKDDGGIVGL